MKRFLLSLVFCTSIIASKAQQQIPYGINNFMTVEDKLYALSKVWSEAKYNEVYFNNVDEDVWDSTYLALIKPVIESKSDNECYRLLSRYCAMLKDGHSFVFYEYDPTVTTYFDKFQITVQPIESKAFVAQISSKSSDWIPVGSEIIEVNGMPSSDYIKEMVLPYQSSSTEHHLIDISIRNMFRSLKYDAYDITFETPDGKEIRTHVIHDFPPEIKEDPLIPAGKEWKFIDLKWYKGNVAYIAINSFTSNQVVEDFNSIFPEIKKRAKKLIIDIRDNSGGNNYTGAQILSRLTPNDELVGSIWFTRIHNPAYMSWGKDLNPKDTIGNSFNKTLYEITHRTYYEKKGEHKYSFDKDRERLVIPTVILIGHQTFSAAEDFLVMCNNQEHITFIGEVTGGSTGNSITWDLPYGGTLTICSKKDTYPDGSEFVGYGIKPDIESHLTVDDFRKARDTVLETALDFFEK